MDVKFLAKEDSLILENAWSADRLRLCRKKKGITQERLGELIGVHVNSIRKWEEGKACPVSKRLGLLASVLGTTVAYLSGETDVPERDAKVPELSVPDMPEKEGALVYEYDGERIVLPPTAKGYELFEKLVLLRRGNRSLEESPQRTGFHSGELGDS